MSLPPEHNRPDESRFDELREKARETGQVTGRGATVQGGPISPSSAEIRSASEAGYYGRPVVKPPVWTWEVPVYFFVGGTSGMSAVIALATLIAGGPPPLTRAALWLSAAGAVLAPVLLTKDLGRPARFLNMLRVFKWRSPMSVGAWTLVLFGLTAVPAAILFEWSIPGPPVATGGLRIPLWILASLAAVSGAMVTTYTGVLLGATAVPAWAVHHRILPIHFGIAGLGSAAAILEWLGVRPGPLHAIGLGAAVVEAVLFAWAEAHRHGPADGALREGRSGLLLRSSGLLTGPLSLALRLPGWRLAAGICFVIGALLSRFAWVAAGRASAEDPSATFAMQRDSRAAGSERS